MPITFPGLVVSGAVISAAHINGIRNALVSVYGEVYDWTANVDASGFNLSAVGVLGASSAVISGNISAGSISGVASVALSPPAPTSTSGSEVIIESAAFVDGGNAIGIKTYSRRITAGTGHATHEYRIGRYVDATIMGHIGFGSNSVTIGFDNVQYITVNSSGHIKHQFMRQTDPGAGSMEIWSDPSDGYRLKWRG